MVAQRVTIIAVPERKILDHQRHEIVVTKNDVPPELRASRQAVVTSSLYTMASDELAVVEAQHAACATLPVSSWERSGSCCHLSTNHKHTVTV